MTAQDSAAPHSGDMSFSTRQRVLIWLVLSVLTALVVYFGFRGYLSPDLLFHFVSGLHC
jgi:cytochrome c oxidase subunit IV